MIPVTNINKRTSVFNLDSSGCIHTLSGCVVGVLMQDYGDFLVDFSDANVVLGISQLLALSNFNKSIENNEV